MKKLALVLCSILIFGIVLAGCNSVTSRLKNSVKESKENLVKSEEQMIERAANESYAVNGTYPSAADIEKELGKSMASMDLKMTTDGKGKYTINSNSVTTIPDYTFEVK